MINSSICLIFLPQEQSEVSQEHHPPFLCREVTNIPIKCFSLLSHKAKPSVPVSPQADVKISHSPEMSSRHKEICNSPSHCFHVMGAPTILSITQFCPPTQIRESFWLSWSSSHSIPQSPTLAYILYGSRYQHVPYLNSCHNHTAEIIRLYSTSPAFDPALCWESKT